MKTPAHQTQTTEQAQIDIECLLRLALDMCSSLSSSSGPPMNDIVKRWGIER